MSKRELVSDCCLTPTQQFFSYIMRGFTVFSQEWGLFKTVFTVFSHEWDLFKTGFTVFSHEWGLVNCLK
jgi:hypothetical protein